MAREDSTPGSFKERSLEIEVACKDGSTVWLEAAISAVRDPEGRFAGFQGACRDITERMQAEEDLKRSEEHFRTIIEKSSDVIIILDSKGIVLYQSPNSAALWGPGANVQAGFDVFQGVHPDDAPAVSAAILRLLEKPEETAYLEVRVRASEERPWRVVNVRARNLLDHPSVGGIVVNATDVTERRRAEDALRASEERLRLFADNVTDVIWITDMNMKPLYISPSVTRMLGYSVEEAMSAGVQEQMAPESLERSTRLLGRALSAIKKDKSREVGAQSLELELRHKDGSVVWIDTMVNIIRDSSGQPAEVVGVLRDVTARKNAEMALRMSEERFRSLCETTSDWVWETDPKATYTYVSPKVRDILGYEPEEVLNKKVFDFMPPNEAHRVSRLFHSHAKDKKPLILVENVVLHKDGHTVVMETSGVPILNGGDTLLGYRGIDRDITKRKKVEQDLQRSLTTLERTMESTIEAITSTIETRDPYTTGHQVRVTDLACAIGRAMGLPSARIEGIRVAGLLHDIGKIAVPTEILSKPGRLSEVEFEMIKTHTTVGHSILSKIEFKWPVATIVLQHHERWDGSGYPNGIGGAQILLEARILAVADVMEAISSHRPYRPSLGMEKALDEISQNSGRLYDPDVVVACKKVFVEEGFRFRSQ